MDEVGRGCLAGPVVACAVILKEGFSHERLIDSKKLTEKRRESMARLIMENSAAYAYGSVCSGLIDQVNILRATKQAMHKALSRLAIPFDRVIIDAVKLRNIDVPMEHPFKAEDSHPCVAAASILAKVYRDRLMKRMHIHYPEYGWYSNKGYGAKIHMEAIAKYGPTPLHRMSFLK
ncbi:ribonuclease HII [Limisalsivibrio acetivorans]|uniref:ribonuclease HII n=1 Tax=Limisalsivibrio acetivorans TaxID=1304888 RepID=UPI0003B68125|nr:ribonuclease HII [Limisalsivibrio acetivorans]